MLSPYQLRYDLYDTPEWELRGMNNMRILGTCRFPTTQRYFSACQDESFWDTLVATRYPKFLLKPDDISWYQWYSRLVLNGDILFGLETTGLPNLYTFKRETTLKQALDVIVNDNRLHDISLDVTLPSNIVVQVDVENGRYISRANINRSLDRYQGVTDPSLASFYIQRSQAI